MKEFIFGNVAGYRPAVLPKKEFFPKLLPRFSWQNHRTAILKKTFSIRALPVAASVYTNKKIEVNILQVL